MSKVCVIGAGSWGTAIAGVCAARADQVIMWSHDDICVKGINAEHRNPLYLNGYQLPHNVVATQDFKTALADVDGIVVVVPSAFLRATAHAAAPYVDPEVPVLVLTKGIEAHTGKLMTDVVGEEFGNPDRVGALSGPNHAEEVCKGALSAAVIAATSDEVAHFFRDLLISAQFRIYRSRDVIGVETCAAVKNVIAIVCGVAHGLGYGDNALAMIMTRGIAEISRVVAATGGDPLTCMGLAGMGDLVVTCTSEHSRNRSFGQAFAAGESLEAYQERTHMIVEGALAAQSVSELARAHGVDAPLTFALDDALHGKTSLKDVLQTLVERTPHDEFYGLYEHEKEL